MAREESIVQSLVDKFGFLEGKCTVKRERRITAEVPRENFLEVVRYVSKELAFPMLCTITGLDMGEEIQMIYHTASEDGVVLNLKLNVPKTEPVINTVREFYNGSEIAERELKDMLGVVVEGLPKGHRYPLPDGWPEDQYPLRKDWKPEMLQQSKGEA